MEYIEAIYQGGVFKPEGAVHLRENQRVRLRIEAIEEKVDWHTWLEGTQRLRAAILERRGGIPLPDSTPDIAEDRMRDI
jgi:predicted DNA-binding antitoxin AbrB/MazE fold protein